MPKVKAYSLNKEPIAGICKRPSLWAHFSDVNSIAPLMYLLRPKWIKSDAVWDKILDSIRLELPKDMEVK